MPAGFYRFRHGCSLGSPLLKLGFQLRNFKARCTDEFQPGQPESNRIDRAAQPTKIVYFSFVTGSLFASCGFPSQALPCLTALRSRGAFVDQVADVRGHDLTKSIYGVINQIKIKGPNKSLTSSVVVGWG